MNINRSLWTPGSYADTILPAGGYSKTPHAGTEMVDLKSLGIVGGIGGGAPSHGIHAASDVVTKTADGRDLNTIWQDFMDLLSVYNAERETLIDFLTFSVGEPVESVAMPGSGVDFEEASEYGEPVGARIQPTYWNLAYGFKWYDLAARYTWQYLADATSQMVDSVANAAVEAHTRLRLNKVLRTIFNPTNEASTINGNPFTVYRFYNNDGTTPPDYRTNTFLSTHTHYIGSNGAVIDAGDLEEQQDHLNHHGYTKLNGYTQVTVVNKVQGDAIRLFKSTANGGTGKYDFIPAQGSPGMIIPQTTVVFGATQVANTFKGLDVIGTYGDALIIQNDWMPAGYVFSFATGGRNNLTNPVGFREHANSGLRGLRLVKGRNPDYPLIDSYWATGFGTGIRNRGAGVVTQIVASTTYTVPALYA
jgi:hypothetical protein